MKTEKPESTSPLASFSAGPLRVTYRDTDRMGHVYHSQYLVWFEVGRTDLLRSLGSTYRDWEDIEGIYLPVRECHIKFRNAAQYDDLVVIDTQMVRLTRASVAFEYKVRRQDTGELLATGGTSHAFIDANGKVCRVADRLLPAFFKK